MAGVTARMAPSGKAGMVARNQASRKRGTGVEGCKIGRRGGVTGPELTFQNYLVQTY
jgi:hypothetical protein